MNFSTTSYGMLRYVRVELATRLDEGKGLSRTVADIKDANKRGALHFAAREGKTEVCKYLLEELKLEVDTKDEDGKLLIRYLFIYWENLDEIDKGNFKLDARVGNCEQ